MHRTRNAASRRSRLNILGVLTTVALILLWQGVAKMSVLNLRFLPTPFAVLTHSGTLVHGTHLGTNLVHTLEITLESWILASIGGTVLGLALGLSPFFWRWSMASIDILRGLPAIVFLPVAVLLLGISSTTELVIALYGAFWPVMISAIAGVRSVNAVVRDVGKTLRLSRADVLLKIIMPSAFGSIIVGIRLALTMSLVLAVVAEMLINPKGLGYQLVFEEQAIQPELMFGYVIVVGLLAIALNGSFRWATRRLAPGLVLSGGGRI